MKHKLEWMSEEEGRITFFEEKIPFLTAQVFITDEEEAEFRLQDVVFLDKTANIDKMQDEIIHKVTNCILECFRLLWTEGFPETVLVESNGTKLAEILDSTNVVQKVYSEYMMKCRFESQKSTDCGATFLKLTKTEEGYSCENTENTFFCRLLPYGTEQSGEGSVYLYEVEVNKKKRNRGIATACLKELFRLLSADTAVTVYLQVGSYNEPAVHVYEKLGFKVSEELCYYAMEE